MASRNDPRREPLRTAADGLGRFIFYSEDIQMAKKKVAKAKKADSPASEADVADRLREETIAVRFSRRVFGARRSLTEEQRQTAAEAFGAGKDWVAGGKLLLDTKRDEYKRATGRVLAALTFWREMTVPYPENGIRLLRRSRLKEFEDRMREIRSELDIAVRELQHVYEDAKEQARVSLVDLYNPDDYPDTLIGTFGIDWSFPSVDPPAYLRKLNPELYEQQQAAVKARFAQAVIEAEQMLAQELATMLERWIATLTPGENGKRRKIRDDSVEGFRAMIARVKEMAPGASSVLRGVVEQAEFVASGISPKDLKNDNIKSDALKDKIEQMRQTLAAVVEDAPERAIELED